MLFTSDACRPHPSRMPIHTQTHALLSQYSQSHAPSLNISEILNQHAAVEAQANETIATLRTEKDDLEETVGTLLEQLARQDEKLEAANRRADGFHSIEEELHAANTRVDDLFSMNEELKASNASAALSTKRDDAERQALMQQVRRLHEELDQHDSELKHLVTRLRKVVSPQDFQELIAGLQNERNADLSGNTKSGQRSRSPHSVLNSPETLIKF